MAVKRDAAQRKATEARYRKIFRQRCEGESIRALAKRFEINHHTLAHWSLELRRRDAQRPKPKPKRKGPRELVPVQLQEVRLERGALSESFEVQLRNDRVVRIPATFDASSLKRLIGALEE